MVASRRLRCISGMKQLDQLGGARRVLGREGMADGLFAVAVAVEPVAGAPVQQRQAAFVLVRKMGAQHLGEEVVVPVPLPTVVERNDKEIVSFERRDRRLAVAQCR